MIYYKKNKAICVPLAYRDYQIQQKRRQTALRMLLFLVSMALVMVSLAQTQVVVKATPTEDDKLQINYNIVDTVSSRLYDVYLFAHTDTGSFALKKLEGDYVKNISVGEHQLLWDALGELERFDGKMVIEVKAIPQFLFLSPKRDERVVRGYPITFSWYGGNSTEDQMLIQLYRYDELLNDSLGVVNRQGSYTWQVPSQTASGGGYRIRLVGTDKSGINAFSFPITVDERIPKTYKYIAAGTGVVGAVILIAQLLRILPPPFEPNR